MCKKKLVRSSERLGKKSGEKWELEQSALADFFFARLLTYGHVHILYNTSMPKLSWIHFILYILAIQNAPSAPPSEPECNVRNE